MMQANFDSERKVQGVIRTAMGAFAIAVVAGCGGGSGVDASIACDTASLQAVSPTGTTIDKAELVAVSATLPEYCSVTAHYTAAGMNGEPTNQVNYFVQFPTKSKWNGKVNFQGGGGLATGRPDLAVLHRGFAVAYTDGGKASNFRSRQRPSAPFLGDRPSYVQEACRLSSRSQTVVGTRSKKMRDSPPPAVTLSIGNRLPHLYAGMVIAPGPP